MPRETIRKLSENVGRLLVAGGHLAPSDTALASSRDALAKLAAQLGDKAPVIGKLAEATRVAIAAPGKDAARELLTLAMRVSQVRAAQAQPAAGGAAGAGELQPLLPVPAVATPCNAKDLDDVYKALVEPGQGRMEIVTRAVEGDYIADLRLVDAVIHAMADVYIGDTVTEQAVPKLGRAVVAPIRQRLDIKGKTVDARRLAALVAVEKTGARDLLERALREGSAEVREAALDAIADHVPGVAEFEPLVLELIEKERARDARRAAIRALAGFGSDASLAALMDGLDLETTRAAAGEALGRSTHPQAVRRMLDRIGEALAAPPPKSPAASKANGKKPAKKKNEPPKDPRKEIVKTLLAALAQQKDPQIASAAMELVPRFGAVAAAAVVQSGNPKQLAQIADLLREEDDDLFPVAAQAAVALGTDEALRRFGAVFKAKDRDGKRGQQRMAAAAATIDPAKDPRYVDFLVKIAAGEPRDVAQHVVQPLGATRDRRATKPLLALLDSKRDELTSDVIDALGSIGDPAALDAILAQTSSKGYRVQRAVREAVYQIGDASAVGKVREIYVKLKDPNGYGSWHIRSLLRGLEQRFPGA